MEENYEKQEAKASESEAGKKMVQDGKKWSKFVYEKMENRFTTLDTLT